MSLVVRAPGRALAPTATTLLPLVGLLAGLLVGFALLFADIRVPVLRPVLGAVLLLGVPSFVLARWTFAPLRDRLQARQFAFGLSLLGLIVVALLLNTVLPWAGVERPLARPVLLTTSAVVDVVLVAWASTRVRLVALGADGLVRALRVVWTAPVAPEVAMGVAAAALSVTGAVRLNNGHSGGVAVAGHIAAMAALALAVGCGVRPRRTVTTLYLAGLALLLGTSLRGWYIVGHDIQNEYLSYTLTHDTLHWSMSAYPSAYHACLSVNILPVVLGQVLGLSGVVVFKLVTPLIFALVPVTVYAAGRRIVTPAAALLGAAVFMIFPTFLTDMPFLTRQEIAFVFVALALLAAGADEYRPVVRQCLTLAFGIGVVLSHYSTTYVLIATLVLSMIGSRLLPAVVRRRRARKEVAAGPATQGARPRLVFTMLAPGVVVAIAAAAWTWSTPITHSGSHLTDTISELTTSIIDGKTVVGSSDLKFIGGGGPSAQQRFDEYYRGVLAARADSPVAPIVDDVHSPAAAQPELTSVPATHLTPVGRALDALGVPVGKPNLWLRAVAGLALEGLLLVGLIALLIKVRASGRVWDEQVWLVLGSIGAVGVIVVVPGLSAAYGVLRAFQQALLMAAPLIGVGLLALLVRTRHAIGWAAVAVLALGVTLSGALAAVFGGTPGVLSQADSGQYYELLYTDAPEMAAAHWLAADLAPHGQQFVGASDIVPITRLQTILPKNVAVTPDFLPVSLRKGEYLFLTPQTVVHGRGTVFSTGDLLTYAYPQQVIDDRLDLIYSSGTTEIYR